MAPHSTFSLAHPQNKRRIGSDLNLRPPKRLKLTKETAATSSQGTHVECFSILKVSDLSGSASLDDEEKQDGSPIKVIRLFRILSSIKLSTRTLTFLSKNIVSSTVFNSVLDRAPRLKKSVPGHLETLRTR